MCRLLLGLCIIFMMQTIHAKNKTLRIYHDADYTSHLSSAESMAMGFNTALSEVNHSVQGYSIELIPKDHRGNTKRSTLHLKKFLNDTKALAVLGGLHSSPYISNRRYINQNKILLLVPWAAGGPITRYSDGVNWVFRVSVDDTKVGHYLGQYAVNEKQCQSPHLLLENTGWGKFNADMLREALVKKGISNPGMTWFDWNTKEHSARILVRNILASNNDCLIFVGNSIEGQVFTTAMVSMPAKSRIPFISHWGITGGDFSEFYRDHLAGKLDLSFIQTCFSFMSTPNHSLAEKVLQQAYRIYPDILQKAEDINAPAGFIHAYDLGKIILAALETISLSDDMPHNRALLRDALENITTPVEGLVKTYSPPFGLWSIEHPGNHEALTSEDFCMGEYNKDGVIHLK